MQHRAADNQQVHAARGAVNQRDAVKEKAGGETAQQEVFQRRLVAALVVAQVSGQDVARDRGDLQANKNHDQVVRRRHQALSRDREQQQRVIFAGLGALPRQETVRREDGQDAHRDHQHPEERGEAIHHEHAAECRPADCKSVNARTQRRD